MKTKVYSLRLELCDLQTVSDFLDLHGVRTSSKSQSLSIFTRLVCENLRKNSNLPVYTEEELIILNSEEINKIDVEIFKTKLIEPESEQSRPDLDLLNQVQQNQTDFDLQSECEDLLQSQVSDIQNELEAELLNKILIG